MGRRALIILSLALAPRSGGAQALTPCTQCVAVVSAVSETSVALLMQLPANGSPKIRAVAVCVIEYTAAGGPTHSLKMERSGTTTFQASIVALAPSTLIAYRVVCDEQQAGSWSSTVTLASAAARPAAPVVVSSTRVGDVITFEFTSDPKEPTVCWPEVKTSTGANAKWVLLRDYAGTYAKNKLVVISPGVPTRLGVRNSGGFVYSPIVP